MGSESNAANGSPLVIRDSVLDAEVALGLRDIRKLRRHYRIVSWLGFLTVIVLGFVWTFLALSLRWAANVSTLSLGIGWIWLSGRLERCVALACCPRCGEPFFARRWGPLELHGVFFGSCQHCGLHLRADKKRHRDV